MLLRLYRAGRVLAQRVRTIISDERGDVPGWVLVTGMTVGLVMMIWGVASGVLSNLVTNFLNGVCFGQC